MSKEAPWIALAIDWQDSEMLDDAPHGDRLAWICLLCHAKAQGRAGRVRLRDKAFATAYRLSTESVQSMVARATKAKAITREGDVVTITNWRTYQDPRVRTRENHRENSDDKEDGLRFTKTPENDATTHTTHTDHQPPKKSPSRQSAGADDPLFVKFWDVFPSLRKQKRKRAFEAWQKAIQRADPELIIKSAREYAASPKGCGEFVQGPEPWLNGDGWDDDRAAWRTADGAVPIMSLPPQYRQIPLDQFKAHITAGEFLLKPKQDEPDASGYRRVFGTLRTHRKVESHTDPDWRPQQ